MSMIVSFYAVIFPRDVLDLIESVSEKFPTYFLTMPLLYFLQNEDQGHYKDVGQKPFLPLRLILYFSMSYESLAYVLIRV